MLRGSRTSTTRTRPPSPEMDSTVSPSTAKPVAGGSPIYGADLTLRFDPAQVKPVDAMPAVVNRLAGCGQPIGERLG